MDVVKNLFGNYHEVSIGFNGICWFLSDAEIKHAMEVLYDWADKGSIVFITDGDMDSITEEFMEIINIYKQMNQFVGMRTKKTLIELVKPWKVEEPGFIPVEEYIKIDKNILEKTIQSWGGGGLYGGFLKK